LIIRTNYGDESIALVQWAYEAKWEGVVVVYVSTGWEASCWEARILAGEDHVRRCGYELKHLKPTMGFQDYVRGRGAFPSAKFQWCAGFLKALPFLDWLESWDKKGEAIVLLAKRKSAALAQLNMPEWIESCEYHNERSVWHPLINLETRDRDALLASAGFSPLNHRSLECEPCVNSSASDIKRISAEDKLKLKNFETEMGCSFFTEPLLRGEEYQHYLDLFYRGCGNRFGCGL
jgi:3'-phosphoadenosine 5'-phosphosulfate sulfotransferase (PAPS reductase)/FAD synthetase